MVLSFYSEFQCFCYSTESTTEFSRFLFLILFLIIRAKI